MDHHGGPWPVQSRLSRAGQRLLRYWNRFNLLYPYQHTNQQASLAAAFGEKVFAKKVSGAQSDRKGLAKAIAAFGPGDVLLVTRLDRLARSTRDLLNVLAAVGKAGAGFKSLADLMIDTTSPHGKLILAVLGALAEFERSMILARTNEGRKRAMARGIKFGRKLKLSRFQIAEALARREAGEPLVE